MAENSSEATPAAAAEEKTLVASDPLTKRSPDLREVGDQAVWSLSTAKPGNGVEQLRDSSTDTYWQSDGPQPHLVNIQFHKNMGVE
jgi:anaphase-promoting complex subunit 10